MRYLIALLWLLTAPAWAAPADEFGRLQDDYWAWQLREDPLLASRVGERAYDDRLPDISLAAEDRRAVARQAFLDRLEAIPASALSEQDQVNRAVLRRRLSDAIEANRYPQRVMLFTTYYGWHQDFAGLAEDLPFRSRADYRSYLARLALYPRLNDEALTITEQAVRGGYVLPCSALGGYDRTIGGVIAADPNQSRFFIPFHKPRPADVGESEWQGMQAEARRLIADALNPAYAKHLTFYRTRYLPRCSKTDSVAAQAGGRTYYAFRVRQETTTDLAPDAIHAIGLAEVKRIGAEMDALAKKAGYDSRAAFIAELRTGTAYYAKSGRELLAEAAFTAKTIEARLPEFFGTLPRLPFGLRPVPPETAEGTTTAYYSPGAPESGIAGIFYVNTSRLDQRPLWELPALAAHEAVPGHHLQIALQQELDLPAWRRHDNGFTAFTEGWGLYAERLGIELGLYDTPAKQMGRLSYEMWRACRLVVDTGIHARGWTKARAQRFMAEHTTLSPANTEAELNRYISWPGQALAYKIGEMRIRQLRGRAERALGARFDLRRFHDALLGGGAVPLDVLDAQIIKWIANESDKNKPVFPGHS